MTNSDIYETHRNKISQTRYALAYFLNTLSISNMDSIRTQLGVLSKLTSHSNEISRDIGVILKT